MSYTSSFEPWLARYFADGSKVGIAVAVVASAIAIRVTAELARRLRASRQLARLPGPDAPDDRLWNNWFAVSDDYDGWLKEYGLTFQNRGILGLRHLCTADPRAITHVLSHPHDFPKPPMVRERLVELLGNGVIVVEGDVHRRQRRIMNPCFGPNQVRDLIPIFTDKAAVLREELLKEIKKSGNNLDLSMWLKNVTLDIIGLAGFGYDFDSLSGGGGNEITRAFRLVGESRISFSLMSMLRIAIPALKPIPVEARRAVVAVRAVIDRFGRQLVNEKRAAILAAGDQVDKSSIGGRDVLSVLIKANMAAGLSPSERMSDEEVMDQITTMLIAGHETTATTMDFMFYDLAKPEHQHIQDRLREELASLPDSPSIEELNSLPYFDAVVKEVLRKSPVVEQTVRVAREDCTIPLLHPWVDSDGVEHREVTLMRGQAIRIPIRSINRLESLWGEDAQAFNPDRWLSKDTHPTSSDIPGIYGGLLTFINGPRHCIGFRFAVAEIKAIAFEMVRTFKIELSDTTKQVEWFSRASPVAKPIFVSEDGSRRIGMPLKLTPLES